MGKSKRMNIPCHFSSSRIVNSNLVPVKITILHDGINRNNTNFDLESIKDALPTIKNKPILAYIREDNFGQPDFAGHEIDVVIDNNGDLKYKYYEYPVGIIPESSTIEFVEKAGKTYVTCTGYIYYEYSNETIEIMNQTGGKCVSIEITINEGETLENGVYNIKSFDFLGVTILSDEVTPAMDENCRIEFVRDNENYAEFLNKAISDVKKYEEDKTTEDNDKKNKKKDLEGEKESPDEKGEKNSKDEESVKDKDLDEKDKEKSDDKPKEKTDDESDDKKEEQQDEDPTDKPTDEKNKDNVESNINSDEGISNNEYSIFNGIFDTKVETSEQLKELFLSKISDIETELESVKSENKKIKEENLEYKQIERNAQINELLESLNFDFEDEDISELLEKTKNFKMSVDELEKELFAIIGKKNILNSKNNKKKKEFSNEGIIFVGNTEKTKKSNNVYSELFKDIF